MNQQKSITNALAAEARKDYLSREDLIRLIRKYQRTKTEPEKTILRDQVISNNLRLVLKIANSYSHRSNSTVDDLFQCGILGVIDAVDKFKPSKGCAFSTYATWHIIKHIRDEVSSSNVVDTKRFTQGAPKARLYKKLLVKADGDYEKLEDLLRKNGITRKMQDHIEHVITMSDSRSFMSLSTPINAEGDAGFTLADIMVAPGPSPESEVLKKNLYSDLRAYIAEELTEKERLVIQSVYFDGVTVRETAKKMHCSGATIRNHELRALRKLIRRFKNEDDSGNIRKKFKTTHLDIDKIIDPEAVRKIVEALKKKEAQPATSKNLHLYEMTVKEYGSTLNVKVLSPSMRGAINFVRENTKYYFDIEVISVDGVENPVKGLNFFFRDMTRQEIAKVLEEVAVSRWK